MPLHAVTSVSTISFPVPGRSISLRGVNNWQPFVSDFKRLIGEPSPTADKLNADIFKRLLDYEIAGLDFHGYRLPLSKAGGFHIYFPDLYLFSPFGTVQDYSNYLARLEALPRYFDESIDLLRLGLQTGYIPARVTLEGVDDSVNAQIVTDPADSIFYKPFEKFPPQSADWTGKN